MHWFGGSIAEAVTLSKQKNAIFVVFVEGDNELSTEMTQVLDDGDVLKRLSDDSNFLAIKLQSGSINYTHFAKIYQFVPVPSLFFIGRNGTPLEVVCAGIQPNNLAERIDRILDEHHKTKPVGIGMQPSTSGTSIKEQTANLIQSEANTSAAPSAPEAPAPEAPAPEAPTAPVPTSGATGALRATEATVAPALVSPVATAVKDTPESESSSGPAAKIPKLDDSNYEVVCDGDVCVRRPRGDAGTSKLPDTQQAAAKEDDATSSLSAEKMQRAKELIEAKRREKAEKEKQLEREKERERRSLGQGVAELARWQTEQEMKQIQEERKREKIENNLVRQRILEQIALDRAERKSRESKELPSASAPAPATAPLPQATSGDGSARARIQFKLPDGSSHTAHFDATDNLGDVRRYVADNLQLSASQFSLWTAFPRRELTEHTSSLRNLQLAPSAALIVLPRRTNTVARPGGVAGILAFLTQLFTSMIIEPTHQLYNWIMSRFSRPPETIPRGGNSGTGTQGTGTLGTATGSQLGANSQPGPRRRGNVHRLTGDVPPDDDNNTWNGNSTQQM